MTRPYNSSFEEQFDPDRAQERTILTLLQRIHTLTVVKVEAVAPVSDRVGFVTCIPLILDVDTGGIVIGQSPIYNVPYFRLQGGASAVLLDPAPGDIGLAAFAERDITDVKATLTSGAPATARTYSSADALYLGGFLNGAPTQYVQFLANGAGIKIHTPGDLTLEAPAGAVTLTAGGTATISAAALVVNAPVTFNDTVSGTKSGPGNYSFPNLAVAGVNLETHKHTDVQTGTSNSGGPTN